MCKIPVRQPTIRGELPEDCECAGRPPPAVVDERWQSSKTADGDLFRSRWCYLLSRLPRAKREVRGERGSIDRRRSTLRYLRRVEHYLDLVDDRQGCRRIKNFSRNGIYDRLYTFSRHQQLGIHDFVGPIFFELRAGRKIALDVGQTDHGTRLASEKFIPYTLHFTTKL